jgi:hypothetical protein
MRRAFWAGSIGAAVLWGCAGQPNPAAFADLDAGGADGAAPVDPGAADGASPSGKQPCVHTDDCTGPNMCQAANGLSCVGGFCVPTGKPMDCNDGVLCTEDSCDANTNKCVHKPNDAACPNQAYCDPTQNCVQSLPCTPGDQVCDRLNTTACSGLWSCDANRKLCVRAPKPCPDRTNATTSCTAQGTQTTCGWACNPGFADTNGDLSAAPPATSNGCECTITNANDKPDMSMVDANCDGIDGTVTGAVFVDGVGGNDTNAGTMTAPKRSVQAGVAAAAAANPTKDVYVSKGTYNEALVVADGVSVYGGYDAAAGWSRSLANTTTLNSPSSIGAFGQNLTKATELQLLAIVAQSATGLYPNGDGRSSFGVLIVSSSGGVTVRGCNVTAGSGAAGAAGAKGGTGVSGTKGGDATGTTEGGQGPSACGAPGGSGGPGVNGPAQGNGGNAGTQAPNGGTAAAGGSGGGAGSCSLTSSSNGGSAPAVASSGGQGAAGTNGSAGGTFGALDTIGAYLPPVGGDGLTTGYPGGGGGGGGSGGGTASGTNLFCTNCSNLASGGGGGGGGGGCGGGPGSGGRGGGGSFAIGVVSSAVTIDGTRMATANGGAGGRGGDGGDPGGPGPGGTGAGGQGRSNSCSARSAGNGADGSAGGSGGRGGGAGGGTGGPSVCVVYKGGAPVTSGTQCTNGGGGTGGSGGTNGISGAPKGNDGVTGDIRAAL